MSKALTDQLANTIMSNRAVDNWAEPLPSDFDLADAIIAALPDMVQPLVWKGFTSGPYEIEVKEGGIAELRYWGCLPEDGEAEYLQGGYLTLISLDDLKATADTHNRHHILSAFGITEGET